MRIGDIKYAETGLNITPHATNLLPFVTREVVIQKDDDLSLVCDIAVVWADDTAVTLTGLPPGRYAWAIKAVRVTGTTATKILIFK